MCMTIKESALSVQLLIKKRIREIHSRNGHFKGVSGKFNSRNGHFIFMGGGGGQRSRLSTRTSRSPKSL